MALTKIILQKQSNGIKSATNFWNHLKSKNQSNLKLNSWKERKWYREEKNFHSIPLHSKLQFQILLYLFSGGDK